MDGSERGRRREQAGRRIGSRAFALRWVVFAMTMLALNRFVAEAELAAGVSANREPPGWDVFVMAREAILREKPSRESRFVGKLPGGSRVKLLEGGEKYLKVEVAAGGTARTGYPSRDVTSVFSPDEASTRELVTLGRALAASEGHRRLAAAFLLRASERLTVGGTRDGPRKRSAVPVLPVPGSLRLSPDGKSVAWVEIASPSKLVPIVASLEKDDPARQVGYVSSGRPLSGDPVANVLSSLSGYSKDGQRLGVLIQAWNETAPAAPRYSVVSVATGDLLFETSQDIKGFQRLVQ